VDGDVYEGIFRVFSPHLELTVDVAHFVDPADPGKMSEDSVKTMVFHMKDVVRCSAVDTDLDYATNGKKPRKFPPHETLSTFRRFVQGDQMSL
jgi:hypothetical protein